jgi:hypothetical protein
MVKSNNSSSQIPNEGHYEGQDSDEDNLADLDEDDMYDEGEVSEDVDGDYNGINVYVHQMSGTKFKY